MLCGSLAPVVPKGPCLPVPPPPASSYLFELSLAAAQQALSALLCSGVGSGGGKGSRGGGQPVVGTQGTGTRGRRTRMAVLLARSPSQQETWGCLTLPAASCLLPSFRVPFDRKFHSSQEHTCLQ